MTSSRKLAKRLKTMSKRKTTRRRRRRKATTLSASPIRRRRRSPRRMLSASPRRSRGIGIINSIKDSFNGGMGGAIYTAPALFMKMPLWGKIVWGIGGSMALNMLKYPNMANGHSGAFVHDLFLRYVPTLNDDLLENEYVNPYALSDTGFVDDNGNAVVMDDDGVMYIEDGEELQAIGDAYDLQDDMQTVSMLPLQDPYSNAFNLN